MEKVLPFFTNDNEVRETAQEKNGHALLLLLMQETIVLLFRLQVFGSTAVQNRNKKTLAIFNHKHQSLGKLHSRYGVSMRLEPQGGSEIGIQTK